ncbi:MAG: hypothetical protein JKX86_07390 [Verrucomicrobiales bacterium]|nr:hypothetical protein [Verrucomicrobiales bacterium]
MASKTIIVQPTDRGVNFAYGTAAFHSLNGMAGFGADALRTALTNAAERDAQLVEETVADRVAVVRMRLYGGSALQAAGDAINAARSEKSKTNAADAALLEPVVKVDPGFVLYHRNAVGSLDQGGQAQWIESADLEALSSVAANGKNAANLSDPLWQRALTRYRLENWKARFTGAGAHPAQPGIDEVLATGVDQAAVQQEAESYLAQHMERLDNIAAMESSARQLTLFLSAVFDLQPAEVIDRAMGRTDAKAA